MAVNLASIGTTNGTAVILAAENTIVTQSTSQGSHYGHISFHMQPYMRMVEGPLRGNRYLRSTAVWILLDEGQYIVTEPRYHMHAVGATVDEALDDFLSVIADEFDIVLEERGPLSPRLQSQRSYLQSVVLPA